MTYQEQLLTEEWNQIRYYILIRDGFKCQICGTDDNLNVHHIYYIFGLMAWEYEESMLITLCKKHHEIEHKCLKVLKEYHIKEHLSNGMLAIDIVNKLIYNEIIYF